MKHRLLWSLTARLTFLYAGVCVLSLSAILTVSYLLLKRELIQDIDRDLAYEVSEYGELLKRQDLDVLQDVFDQEAASEGTHRIFFQVLSGSGELLLTTDTSVWPELAVEAKSLQAALDGAMVFSLYDESGHEHPARLAYGMLAPDMVLLQGESLDGVYATLRHFKQVFFLATVAFLSCSLAIGGFMAHRALRGVQRVTQTANAIASGAWESRVPVSNRQDEIDELASAFNNMVEKIHVLFNELREITDDIAHDLRTPVMRLRATADTALHAPKNTPEQREMAGGIIEECDGLLRLINTTLEISETEVGSKPLDNEVIDVTQLSQEVCDLFRDAAEDKGLTFAVKLNSPALVRGERHKVQRAIAHIVDNAIKYTESGGMVQVESSALAGMARLTVTDTGMGIAPADCERIFSRFCRADKSRSQEGNGLGLSLSRVICRAHGGNVSVSSVLNEGSTFRLEIPLI